MTFLPCIYLVPGMAFVGNNMLHKTVVSSVSQFPVEMLTASYDQQPSAT